METEILDAINRKLGLAQVLTRADAEIIHDEAERYNGWTNRETWATFLHLGNDEGLYDLARTLAAEDADGSAVREWIEGLAHEVYDYGATDFGNAQMSKEVKMMISDIGSLWRVDWRAVRDALVDE